MWNSVLEGLILENVETLKHYQTMKDVDNIVEDILQFVSNIITSLPWHFRLPIRIIVIVVGLFCIVMTGYKLNSLPSKNRSRFLKHIQFIPFFTMLNRLVRSLAFLRLFDILPLESGYSNNRDICHEP